MTNNLITVTNLCFTPFFVSRHLKAVEKVWRQLTTLSKDTSFLLLKVGARRLGREAAVLVRRYFRGRRWEILGELTWAQ